MKKLATLLIAAGLVFGASTGASAIDFKASGQWLMSFDLGKNGKFTGGNGITGYGKGGEDQFEASQRVRLQLDAVASEALSGTLYFEIGKSLWGKADGGAALGADGKTIKVRRAYIDWMPPETDLKVRMGLIGLGLPNYTMGKSQVFEDDVAAVTASYQFNENVGLTAFWARPYNDNYNDVTVKDEDGNEYRTGTGKHAGFMDNIDMGGLILPLTFDGFKVTPYFVMAGIGPNALARDKVTGKKGGKDYEITGLNGAGATSWGQTVSGMLPAWGVVSSHGSKYYDVMKDKYATAWWAGVGIAVDYWDPFYVAFDFAAGGVSYGKSRMNRAGWGASLLFEYKLDWGVPGLYGWYYSGDNGDLGDGSERMPYVSLGNGDNKFSRFAFDGNPYIAREGAIGNSMTGTWGIGLRLRDFSFLEDLKHTFRINYIGGTNSPKVLKKMYWAEQRGEIAARPAANNGGIGVDNMYLTKLDSALEFGFNTEYKMYENFTVAFDASYIALWLDDGHKTWGQTAMNGKGGTRNVRDAWNLNLTFAYEF